jgi:hypothetical protein
MTNTAGGSEDLNSVRKVVTVEAPPAIAWRVFTDGMSTWWPLAQYKIGQATAELEHRRLDRYGARRDEMRAIFDQSGDWGRLLAGFAEVAARAALAG